MADSKDGREVKRTVNKIDALRKRVHDTRASGAKTIKITDTFERDIILKALELLRYTVKANHALDTHDPEQDDTYGE